MNCNSQRTNKNVRTTDGHFEQLIQLLVPRSLFFLACNRTQILDQSQIFDLLQFFDQSQILEQSQSPGAIAAQKSIEEDDRGENSDLLRGFSVVCAFRPGILHGLMQAQHVLLHCSCSCSSIRMSYPLRASAFLARSALDFSLAPAFGAAFGGMPTNQYNSLQCQIGVQNPISSQCIPIEMDAFHSPHPLLLNSDNSTGN